MSGSKHHQVRIFKHKSNACKSVPFQDSVIDLRLFWDGSAGWRRHDVDRKQGVESVLLAGVPLSTGKRHVELLKAGRACACCARAVVVGVLCLSQALWIHIISIASSAPVGTALPLCMTNTHWAVLSVMSLACLTTTCVKATTRHPGAAEPWEVLRWERWRWEAPLKDGKSIIKIRE